MFERTRLELQHTQSETAMQINPCPAEAGFTLPLQTV